MKGFLAELGGEPAPDAVRAWFDLEARHFEAWRAGRVSFADQRRLRINDFLELMGMPVPRDPAAAGALFTRYLVRYRRAWRAFDDAVPVLHRLRAEGARIGVLTNGDHAQQIDKLTMIGIMPLIDVVCTSDEIGFQKPDRRAFETLAARLDVPPADIVFIGDHPDQDIAGARTAGLSAGLVDRSATPCAGLAAALRVAHRA